MKRSLLLVLLPLLSACGNATPSKPLIVTSIYPLQFLAESLGGEQIEVRNLTPAGGEPHEHELTVSNVASMHEASAVLLNGLGMEAYADSLPEKVKAKTYVLSDGLTTREVQGKVDPHIYLDLSAYAAMAEKVKDVLLAIPSLNHQDILNRYSTVVEKTERLYKQGQLLSSSIEPKTILVSHAAFGYMFDQFGLEQLYVSGLSPTDEPSPRALETILEAVKEKGIHTVYFESNASADVANAIAIYTGASVKTISAIESLTDEQRALGEDYFSLYLQDLRTLAEVDND